MRRRIVAAAQVALALALWAPPVHAEAPPLAVWVVGDSTAQPIEQGFTAIRKETPHVKVRSFFKNSSGLIRTDVIDWTKTMRGMLERGAPRVAVITFGPNDAQGIVPAGKRVPVNMGTEEWREEYGKRVRAFVDLFRARGTKVYLLLQPFDPEKKHAPLMRDVNAALGKAADLSEPQPPPAPPVQLIDVPALIEAAQPEATAKLKNVDGIHLTFAGGKVLSRRLYELLDADWAATPVESTSPPR